MELNLLHSPYTCYPAAVLYHRWGKLEEARTQYQLSLELDPSDKGTQDNYAMLLRRMTANADMKT